MRADLVGVGGLEPRKAHKASYAWVCLDGTSHSIPGFVRFFFQYQPGTCRHVRLDARGEAFHLGRDEIGGARHGRQWHLQEKRPRKARLLPVILPCWKSFQERYLARRPE